VGRVGARPGVLDHGLLTGLTDDDHAPYALDTALTTHEALDDHPVTFGTYTPTWTAGGPQPALNNGSLLGRYSLSGKLLRLWIELVLGSTTSVGNGDFRFGLPPGVAISRRWAINAFARDASTGFLYRGYALTFWASITGSVIIAHTNNTADKWADLKPFGWAVDDQLIIAGEAEVD
jgi:hypothetical protein